MTTMIQNFARNIRKMIGRPMILAASTAGIALAGFVPAAQADPRDLRGRPDPRNAPNARDFRGSHDRNDPRVSVKVGHSDFRVAQRRWVPPVYHSRPIQVWVEPVYRTVSDRVWVEPVYQTGYDRVWRDPVVRTEYVRVWVPDRWEDRDVERWENGRWVIVRESVLVEPGHYQDQPRDVIVSPGCWETIPRTELVRAGYWQVVVRKELVAPGRFVTQMQSIEACPGRWESQAVISIGW